MTQKIFRIPLLLFIFVLAFIGLVSFRSTNVQAASPGDLNGDGKVTVADLSILLSNLNKTGSSLQGDLNSNGKVDVADLSILLSNLTKTNPTTGTGTFTVSGSKILDPNGNEFIPKGVNVSGPNWVWEDKNLLTSGRVSATKDTWKFNTISVNTCFGTQDTTVPGCTNINGFPSTSVFNKDTSYLDNIVNTYTKAGIVTVISFRQVRQGSYPGQSMKTEEAPNNGSQPSLETVKQWWIKTAAKYKDNPYVWFDVLNEPGWPADKRPIDKEYVYRDNFKTLISAIRDTAKANNIITVQASQYGQDTGGNNTGPNTKTPTQAQIDDMDTKLKKYSGLLAFGNEIRGNYKNIIYNLHVYSGWGVYSSGQTDLQRDNYLNRYFELIQKSGVPIVIGEVGSCNYFNRPQVDNTKTSCADSSKKDKNEAFIENLKTGNAEGYAVESLFRVAPKRKIGVIFWHSQGLDRRILINPPSDTDKSTWMFDRVNSKTTPTNLNYQGDLLWKYTHDQL